MRPRRRELEAQIVEQAAELRRLREASASRRDFTADTRNRLQRQWFDIACMYCGHYHPGLCPSVKMTEQDVRTGRIVVKTRRNYVMPEQTIYLEDVFTDPGEAAEVREQLKVEQENRQAIARVAAEESRRRSGAGRHLGPRDIAARVTGESSAE